MFLGRQHQGFALGPIIVMVNCGIAHKMRHHRLAARQTGGEMETRETPGQAYRSGKPVAAEILLTERARLESTPVPITGTNRVDFKQTPIRGQSTIRFIQVDDLELEDELKQLIAAASDVDLKRRQRDEHWSPKPLDLILDPERNLSGCRLVHPSFGYSAIEATDFPIDLSNG